MLSLPIHTFIKARKKAKIGDRCITVTFIMELDVTIFNDPQMMSSLFNYNHFSTALGHRIIHYLHTIGRLWSVSTMCIFKFL